MRTRLCAPALAGAVAILATIARAALPTEASAKAGDPLPSGNDTAAKKASKTYKVRPDVDLTKQTVGTAVVFRTTQAVALFREQP